MRFGPFPEGFQVLSFAFPCFPQSFTLCAWLRVNDGPSDVGLLCLVYGEPRHVWFFFGSWCRELSQGTLWPVSFLLSAESACGEVGSCQVLVLPGCHQQTSCSAPLELVYLENNLGSSKEKRSFLWYMQEESSWRWWLDSCLDKERCVGAATGHQTQAVPFWCFRGCHSALCSELVPSIFRGLPCVKWGLQHQWMYPVLFLLLCISLPWLWLCPCSHSFDCQLYPLKCLIHAAHDINLYLQPHHPMHWPHWI